MTSELKVRVQWSRGAILPVLTKKTSTASDLSKMLKFACSPNEDIILIHNGVPLNPNLSLESQCVKDNDILEAAMVRKSPNSSDSLTTKIHSIVFEAAKISDMHYNMLEAQSPRYESKKKSSSDDDYYDIYELEKNDEKAIKISTDPLPAFWPQKTAEPQDMLHTFVPQTFSSLEETGQFIEDHGWKSWMW